jgi:hypothetical protein
VTPEQANEILLRTNGDYFSTNDSDWESTIADLFGIKLNESGWLMDWRSAAHWYQSIAGLDLSYIKNSRIVSSWIGGPHGWLDWDGRVGCSTWNIGKWPGYDDVTEDWRLIAATFPYLDLHAQLITNEGEGDVAGQWRVTGGEAALVEPVSKFMVNEASFMVFMHHGERGVSYTRLAEAWKQVRGQASRAELKVVLK